MVTAKVPKQIVLVNVMVALGKVIVGVLLQIILVMIAMIAVECRLAREILVMVNVVHVEKAFKQENAIVMAM